ncbi:MAG TPA: hypothetical protein VEK76_05035 [Candidatus Binatia bacterium]|nr:hypothetical protein [Candidatus Binatia bacterium]
MTGGTVGLLAAVFLACAVEAVEATTIVFAIGVTRGWRPALLGTTAGLATLAVIVGALGPALTLLPIGALRLVVGTLLLIFGLGWLRKAVLRAGGLQAHRDEAAAYRGLAEQAGAVARSEGRFDAYGFTISFKGVLLEGLEVAFIVITFGSNQKDGIIPATLAALAAVLVIVGAAASVRGPLSRVPENVIKYGVGVLLTSFGLFWGTEGAGAAWPASDASLLVLIPAVLVCSLAAVAVLRRGRGRPRLAEARAGAGS